MKIYTPEGKREVPASMANAYKNMSDVELVEILLEQNKKFLDPALVSICIDKRLLKKEMKLEILKVQDYDKLKAEK